MKTVDPHSVFLLKATIMKKIFLALNLIIASIGATAQIFDAPVKAVASDRQSGNQFGSAVAVSGNYAVVGAADISGGQVSNSAQSAYVYERKSTGNWVQVQKLVAPDKEAGDNFGQSVSISGNYIIVGSPYHSKDANGGNVISGAGAAYIFERNASGTWTQVKKLVATDRSANDFFGHSVSISGNYAVVGSPYDDEDAIGSNTINDAGSAYFFVRNANGSWVLTNKAVAHDRNGPAIFGFSVSINGDQAVVGAPFESKDTSGNTVEGAGAAYVFKRSANNTWGSPHKIFYWHRAMGDQFGYAVSITGDALIVGSPFGKDNAQQNNPLLNAGCAHIFEKKEDERWWWIYLLSAPDRAIADNFGLTVSISPKYAVIGASPEDDDINGNNPFLFSGSAYVFMNDPYSQGYMTSVKKIVANDRTANDWFGYAVASSDQYIIVGAPFQDKDSKGIPVDDAGAIYAFEPSHCMAQPSSISPRACNTYTSPSNKYTWTKSGQYKDTIQNSSGCDSIIDINLTIMTNPDTSVTVSGNTLTANAKQATFQWINCTISERIGGATASSFTAKENGNYAVRIDQNGCIAITRCYTIKLPPIDIQPLDQPINPIPQSNSVLKEFVEINKLVAKDRAGYENFGYSVSISGEYAVIGANVDDKDANGLNPINDAGSAYIFKKEKDGKWKQVQKIVASDREAGDNFGWSVTISRSHIVVGAPYHDRDLAGANSGPSSGAAYIFERNESGNWIQTQKIIATPLEGQILFGHSVAVDGNSIAVGSPSYAKDETGSGASNINGAGAVFVFDKIGGNWVQTKMLLSRERGINNIGDGLGNSVSICGNLVVAGASGVDFDANGGNRMEASGAAFIFERSGSNWTQVQKIVAGDRAAYDDFGGSVAISGDNVIIGAWQKKETTDPNSRPHTGNAYIFSRRAAPNRVRPDGGVILTPEVDGKWRQVLKINPDDRRPDDYLGWSVSISGDYAIVSARKQDTDSLDNLIHDGGAIYVFYQDKRGNWSQTGKLAAFDRSQLDNLGYSVAISGCDIIGGTIVDQEDDKDANALTSAGSAYIFSAADCQNNFRCSSEKLLPKDKEPKPKEDPPITGLPQTPGKPMDISGPQPKTDSVKSVSTDDLRNIKMCFDVGPDNTKNIPPRPTKPLYKSLPKIKPNGDLDYTDVTKQGLAAYTDLMWSPGDVITVGMDTSKIKTTRFVADKVKQYARVWETIANIQFSFVDDISKAQVIIGFDNNDGSWSWVGRNVLYNIIRAKTMNYASFSNTTNEDEFKRIIVHEFGHVLGFIHEHQSPFGGIKWDTAKLYKYYAKIGWDRKKVNEQVINKLAASTLTNSIYDKSSIMHYSVSADMTTDGSSIPQNTKLSLMDTAFAGVVYPFPKTTTTATGTFLTGDDCDEIDFSVVYNAAGVDPNVIDFILEPGAYNGKPVTWWKRVGIPTKGGVEINMEIENGSVFNQKIPIGIINNVNGLLSFWKAKLLGVHTLLSKKWNVLPALTGGCRVRLTWRRDSCL